MCVFAQSAIEAVILCLLEYFLATAALIGELEGIGHIWILLSHVEKHAVARVLMRIISKVIRPRDRVIDVLRRVETPRLDRELTLSW